MVKKILALLAIGLLVTALFRCGNNTIKDQAEEKTTYLNLSDTVNYVGIETCRKCHITKHATFIHTGMGSSFGGADTTKSIADISGHTVIHDHYSGYYYHPHWKGDSLFLDEFRLQSPDTVYKQSRRIDYVVGSGQHTNSHLFTQGEYLYQAPFTWYAQEGRAELPPGYEAGHNLRFRRQVGLECTSCHNSMPTGFVKGSVNRYKEVPGAINCERCHGPGELHVKRMMSGQYVDTAIATDYSIVNPKKLPIELQFEVCQRCHLQGNTVLEEGKSFFDFKPGMKLSEVMSVYLPRYSNADDRFIMASHVDRFKQSACFINSKGYNCASCHNPHISVKETNVARFNTQCSSCHNGGELKVCSAPKAKLENKNYNCVECHMPASGPVDIPHVTVHDHYVRKPNAKSTTDTNGISRFLGLVAVNNPKPDLRSKTLAYLQQYERFDPFPYYLDSALYFLRRYDPTYQDIRLWVHYLYLEQDQQGILNLVQKRGVDRVLSSLKKPSYSNEEAWASYRIGEAYNALGKAEQAILFYRRSCELAPYIPDFQNKLGVALMNTDRMVEAANYFKATLRMKPDHREALNNLGYIALLQGDRKGAEAYFKKALASDYNYELAWLNMANLYLQQGNNKELARCLKEVLRINPGNQQAAKLLSTLGEI